MGKAFASPRRLELIDLLAQGPRSVDELARASGQSTANASQHLQALHAAGVVVASATARASTTPSRARTCCSCGSSSATPPQPASRRSSEPRATTSATRWRRSAATSCSSDFVAAVVLVDVRPAEEFDAGHIEGALSIPLDGSTSVSPNCRPAAEIVAYCRGASARTPTRRSARSAPRGAPHDGSKAAGPNGSSRSKH